jgi:hypothetical protein
MLQASASKPALQLSAASRLHGEHCQQYVNAVLPVCAAPKIYRLPAVYTLPQWAC